jgi:antitoxin component YwqK of YwqJK toxin-antitoxin module
MTTTITTETVVLEEHDETHRLQSRTELLNGQLHGRMQRFWPTGYRQMEATYRTGTLDGLLTLYDEAGRLVQTAQYQAGRQHGLTRVFSQGRCVAEQSYHQGLPHGDHLVNDEAGTPAARLQFCKGQLDGLALFYLHGHLVRKATYSQGLLEGESTDYDGEGAIVQVVSHQANVLHGASRRYWPDSTLMEEVIYHQGKPLAPPVRFDQKGRAIRPQEMTASVLERLEKLLRG